MRHELVTVEDQRRAANAAARMRSERQRALEHDAAMKRMAKPRNKAERLALKSANVKPGTEQAARELKRIRNGRRVARINPHGTDGLRFSMPVAGKFHDVNESNAMLIFQAASAEQDARNAQAEARYWRDKAERRENVEIGVLRGRVLNARAGYTSNVTRNITNPNYELD